METMVRKYLVPFVVSLIMLVVCGCANVSLIADYDEQTDIAVTQIQRKMEQFLISLERNMGTDEAAYARNTEFYDEVRVDLSAIRVRAGAIPDNDLTIQQLILLSNHLVDLEKIHRLGLRYNDIPPARTAFNVTCTAILKLELAKKRGKS